MRSPGLQFFDNFRCWISGLELAAEDDLVALHRLLAELTTLIDERAFDVLAAFLVADNHTIEVDLQRPGPDFRHNDRRAVLARQEYSRHRRRRRRWSRRRR